MPIPVSQIISRLEDLKSALEQERSLESSIAATTSKGGKLTADLNSTRARISSLKDWIRQHASDLE